jgi:hypothetical protein
MCESSETFFKTVTLDATGTAQIDQKNFTTTVVRSQAVYAPAQSTLAIHISGTATVVVKSSPFADTAKDFTISTVTTTSQVAIANANMIVLDVTAISGTVTAVLIPNDD